MTLSVRIEHALGEFRLRATFESGARLTALFGPSGSGKTSIVNAIAGLLRPDDATIIVDGVTLADTRARVFVPPHKRNIGYVFQEARLFPHMSVRQNLLYAQSFGGRRSDAGASFESVVEMLGVGHLLRRQPSRLSGGEKQRVAIGRALLSHPRLLLMDEPLASLDEARKQEILPYVERLRDEANVPIVYVSHALAEVKRLADCVVVMDRGAIAGMGAPQTLFSPEAHPADLNMLDVLALEERQGRVWLRTAAGLFALPPGAAPPARVGLRPDRVAISLADPGPTSASAVLAGEVVAIESAEGAFGRVRVKTGEAEIVTLTPVSFINDNALRTGAQVRLLIVDFAAL